MSARRVMPPRGAWALLGSVAVAAALVPACGGGDNRPGPAAGGAIGTGATGGGTGASTSGGSGGASGGSDAGLGGQSGSSGSGGASGGVGGSGGAPGVCGNTIRDGNEECDGSDFGGITCFKLGYDGGTLKCASCKFDKSACTGTENCYDGKDNDGDGNADCADSECSAQCADSCSMTAVLADPNSASGDTTGHASKIANSCSASSGGPEVVYEFHAKYTGVLEVALLPYAALTASVRTSCATSATELGCIAGGRIKLASTANQTYYIVVDGDDANSAGAYAISAETRVITCGDGNRDGNEECDDGGKTPNDGCSATCTLESDEVEPNGTSAQASTYKADYTAAIDPAGDVDVIKFVMPAGKTAMKLDTFDLGDGACAKEELDSVLELLDSNGTTVLYTDDDGGQGTCAQINATGLTPGKTYYVRVTASTVGDVTTFPYRLAIQTS